MDRPLTLKDLAANLGLSVATVSLALRGKGNLSSQTRQRVRELAESLGYRPNTYAAALSARLHATPQHDIPLAVLRRRPTAQSEWYPLDQWLEGLVKQASDLGYRVEIFNEECGQPLSALLRVLYHRGFQGVFLSPIGDMCPELPEWKHFSVLTCGRFERSSPFSTVRHEVFESTLLVIDRLREKGCKRIGLALFDHQPPILDDKQRVGAALISRSAVGRPVVPFFYRERKDFVARVRKERFDGLAAFSIGDYFSLMEAGFSVPGDMEVAILHLCDDTWNQNVGGLLPCEFTCGILAARRMDAMIRNREKGVPTTAHHLLVYPNWRDPISQPVGHHQHVAGTEASGPWKKWA